MEIPRITPQEVKDRLDRGEPILFVDVRNPTDWEQSKVKLPRARRMPLADLERKWDELPRHKTIVTYCT